MSTPTTSKRKLWLLFFLLRDFAKEGLDMVANEKVSYLLGFMHYVIENIAPKVVAKVDRFDLSECYNQAPQSPLVCEYLFESDSFSYFLPIFSCTFIGVPPIGYMQLRKTKF